jgi:vancomycin resistance protein YoaR
MKRPVIIAVGISLVLTGAFIDRFVSRYQRADAGENTTAVAQAQQKNAVKGDTWVAKIDNITIDYDDFEREFNVHVYALPLEEDQKKKYVEDQLNKKNFLKNLINEMLVFRKAVQEGYDKRKDVQDLIKAVTRRTVVQVYLSEKLESKLSEPTDAQIEAVYNQNKKVFANMDIEVARQQIKMQLLQRQYNDLLDDLIEKLKGEAKVVRNEDVKL